MGRGRGGGLTPLRGLMANRIKKTLTNNSSSNNNNNINNNINNNKNNNNNSNNNNNDNNDNNNIGALSMLGGEPCSTVVGMQLLLVKTAAV